jgi:hypothetical protein
LQRINGLASFSTRDFQISLRIRLLYGGALPAQRQGLILQRWCRGLCRRRRASCTSRPAGNASRRLTVPVSNAEVAAFLRCLVGFDCMP